MQPEPARFSIEHDLQWVPEREVAQAGQDSMVGSSWLESFRALAGSWYGQDSQAARGAANILVLGGRVKSEQGFLWDPAPHPTFGGAATAGFRGLMHNMLIAAKQTNYSMHSGSK